MAIAIPRTNQAETAQKTEAQPRDLGQLVLEKMNKAKNPEHVWTATQMRNALGAIGFFSGSRLIENVMTELVHQGSLVVVTDNDGEYQQDQPQREGRYKLNNARKSAQEPIR